MIRRFGFCGGASEHSAVTINAETCENFVPELTAPGQAKSPLVLRSRPGLADFGDVGTGPIRGSLEHNGRLFVVSGTELYEVAADGAGTLLGTVVLDAWPATLHGNGTAGNQVMVVSGGRVYILDLLTDAFAIVADADCPTDAVMGFFLDGYFGVVRRNTRLFALSALFDGTDWPVGQIGEKSQTTDSLVAAVVNRNEVFLIGNRDTEAWWNSGTAGTVPFEPIPNGLTRHGGAAAFAWQVLGDTVYGVQQSLDGGWQAIRFAGGYTPQRISTHAVEQAWQQYPPMQMAAAQGFTLEWQGHHWYGVTFAGAGATWLFDRATGLWSTWSYWDTTTGQASAFLGVAPVFTFGQRIVGSRTDGQLFRLTEDAHDDAGAVLRRVRRAAYIHDHGQPVIHREFCLVVQTGVGVPSGQGETPVGLLRWSDDGGHTWSNERQIMLGAQGVYRTRAVARRLGASGSFGRVYELVVTDPVVVAIADAYVDVEPVARVA
jgi:hypothetical protein